MTQPNAPGDRTADAVECFLCLTDPDADPAMRVRWAAWLGESTENRAAYHAVRDTWNRPVPQDAWPTHEEIINDRYDGTDPIPTADRGRLGGRGRFISVAGLSPTGSRLVLVAGALLVAVMIAGLWKARSPVATAPDSVAYRTGRGEQRRIALADGSAITLGPLSNLSISAGGQGRSARLDGGEAVFAINHNPAQPFKLIANGGEIEDVGTTFGVQVRSGRATVTVVDGAVRVLAAASNGSVELKHDEQVSYAGALGSVGPVDGRAETDWSRGRHAYLDQPLADVAADLTRYTTRDIVLADPAVGALHYTGTIEADAIDQWAAALTRVFPVSAARDGNRLILTSAPKN